MTKIRAAYGALAVPGSIVLIVIVYLLNSNFVYNPPNLSAILNGIFVSIVAFVVAYTAGRAYLATGLRNLLLFGCAMLTFGTSSFLAGLSYPGGPNVDVTIFAVGSLLASLLHFGGAVSPSAGAEGQSGSKRALTSIYVLLLLFVSVLTLASSDKLTPSFFAQGVGSTTLRQVVIGAATALFAFSSVLYMRSYLRGRSDVIYWYSLALALTTIALVAVIPVSLAGDVHSWVGRIILYVGGIYFLLSVLSARKMVASR